MAQEGLVLWHQRRKHLKWVLVKSSSEQLSLQEASGNFERRALRLEGGTECSRGKSRLIVISTQENQENLELSVMVKMFCIRANTVVTSHVWLQALEM